VFLVQVPALQLRFIGQRSNKVLFLTSLSTEPDYKITAGVRVRAEQILRVIVPLAKKQNGLPT
jgi:hypothetical protein